MNEGVFDDQDMIMLTVSQTNLTSKLRSSNPDILSLTRRDVVCYSVDTAMPGTYQRASGPI
jgi:hypothetical protein